VLEPLDEEELDPPDEEPVVKVLVDAGTDCPDALAAVS